MWARSPSIGATTKNSKAAAAVQPVGLGQVYRRDRFLKRARSHGHTSRLGGSLLRFIPLCSPAKIVLLRCLDLGIIIVYWVVYR